MIKKRLIRAAAVLTLTIFVGARMGEALHNLCAGHVEARCAVCQLAHHAPAAGQGAPSLRVQVGCSRIVVEAPRPSAAVPPPLARGRSPPVS